MKPLDKAVIVISCLIALSVLCFVVKWVNADDGSGCSNAGSIMGQIGDCYTPKIYQQNQLLIQEQNQTNKLLAINTCELHEINDGNFIGSDDHLRFNGDLNQCIKWMLNETRSP